MSNYEWQKQYTRQRIDSRRREAELHRMAAEAPPRPRRNPLAALARALMKLVPARRRLPEASLFHSEKQV